MNLGVAIQFPTAKVKDAHAAVKVIGVPSSLKRGHALTSVSMSVNGSPTVAPRWLGTCP